MFTGLVESTAQVRRVEPDGDGVRLEVATPLAAELAHGDSIAVNGVCLTAVEPDGGSFRADVMAETLRRSSLGPDAEDGGVGVVLADDDGAHLFDDPGEHLNSLPQRAVVPQCAGSGGAVAPRHRPGG